MVGEWLGTKVTSKCAEKPKKIKKNASPQITADKLFSEPCLTVLTE